MATSAFQIILSAIELGQPGQAESVESEFAILMRILPCSTRFSQKSGSENLS